MKGDILKKIFIKGLAKLLTNSNKIEQDFISYFDLNKFNKLKLNEPWGMTWINDNKLLVTEKRGNLFLLDIDKEEKIPIKHSIPSFYIGQGGLLDITNEGNNIWITCSIKKENKYTTAVYSAELDIDNEQLINENKIYEALPYLKGKKHFGSRIKLLNNYLYISIGERGEGSLYAQNPKNSIGSIIKIKKNEKVDAKSKIEEWDPEIVQIGIRNAQGMDIDPATKKMYISNHGPKGGDFVGPVEMGTNYGWKKVGWGGTNYSGTKIGNGNAWEQGLLRPDHIWIPSIGISGIKFYNKKIYKNNIFAEIENPLLVCSLKLEYLSVLGKTDDEFIEKIILKDIGRVRDVEINRKGEIFIILDKEDGYLYKLTPKV